MRKPAAQCIVLAHLSKLNNRPRIAKITVDRALAPLGVRPRILIARQERPLEPVTVRRGRVEIAPPTHERQLCLSFPD